MVLETYLNGKKRTAMWKGSRSETQMAALLTKLEISLSEQTNLLLHNTHVPYLPECKTTQN